MTPAAKTLVAEFEAAAKTAQAAEAELRKRMAAEIGRLERQRAFAFRRTRLVRALAEPTGNEAHEPEQVWIAQRQAVRDLLGWSGDSEAYQQILARLQPVGLAVLKRICTLEDQSPQGVAPELAAFESWFEAAHGKSFYALFDQYVPEAPLVDF